MATRNGSSVRRRMLGRRLRLLREDAGPTLDDAGGEQWAELIDLTRETRGRGWWRAYGVGDNSYIGFETEATQVQEFASGFVPGLLQVAGTARHCSWPSRCGAALRSWNGRSPSG